MKLRQFIAYFLKDPNIFELYTLFSFSITMPYTILLFNRKITLTKYTDRILFYDLSYRRYVVGDTIVCETFEKETRSNGKHTRE